MKVRQKKILSFLFLLFFSIVCLLIIISRRPDAITNPQFWAEDGVIWYADAYNISPLKSLFLPSSGHFQTVSRLTAAIAQLFPLIYGPLIFNLVALTLQFLPILLIISPRFDEFLPSLSSKMFIVLIYLLIPNTAEIYLNLNNSQWYLALSAAIVLLSTSPPGPFWNWFDAIILSFSGLSGPFSIFWLPVVLLGRRKLRSQFSPRKLFIIIITGAIQLMALFFSGRGKLGLPLDSTPQLFYTIFYRQIIWGSLVGPNGYNWVLDKISWSSLFFFVTTAFSLLIIIYSLLKGPYKLKLFSFFAVLIFFAGLINPAMIAEGNKFPWQILSETSGIRYWLIPMVGFLTILFWSARKTNPFVIRLIAIFFWSCMILFAIKNYRHSVNYRYPSYIDFHYQEEINKFLKLPKGEKMTIPINPTGWTMNLVRK